MKGRFGPTRGGVSVLGRGVGVVAVLLLAVPTPAGAKGPVAEGSDSPDPRGVTMSGTGLARVTAPRRLSDETIRRAVDEARPTALSRAINEARDRATAVAEASGLTLGELVAVEDRETQAGHFGPFGEDRFCRRPRRSAGALRGPELRRGGRHGHFLHARNRCSSASRAHHHLHRRWQGGGRPQAQDQPLDPERDPRRASRSDRTRARGSTGGCRRARTVRRTTARTCRLDRPAGQWPVRRAAVRSRRSRTLRARRVLRHHHAADRPPRSTDGPPPGGSPRPAAALFLSERGHLVDQGHVCQRIGDPVVAVG